MIRHIFQSSAMLSFFLVTVVQWVSQVKGKCLMQLFSLRLGLPLENTLYQNVSRCSFCAENTTLLKNEMLVGTVTSKKQYFTHTTDLCMTHIYFLLSIRFTTPKLENRPYWVVLRHKVSKREKEGTFCGLNLQTVYVAETSDGYASSGQMHWDWAAESREYKVNPLTN